MERSRSLRNRIPYLVLGMMLAAVAGNELYRAKAARATSAPALRSAPEPARVVAEGRLVTYPGAEVTIGAELDGKIQKLSVQERDRVEAGQAIAEIDVREQRAALNEAWARVREAGSDVAYLDRERRRADVLFTQKAVAEAARDRSTYEAELAAQRRTSLLATATRARTLIDKSRVIAPRRGTVIARHVDEGEMVRAGDPLLTIADLDAVRIEAEVNEFDTARIHLGQRVSVFVEGSEKKSWAGSVEEIPDMVIPRRLRPLDPADPVDTRVLLVKVKLAEPIPLKLGQRVEVEFAALF